MKRQIQENAGRWMQRRSWLISMLAPHAGREAQRWRMLVAIAALIAGFVANARADSYLDAIGGPGGSQFIARCPEGQHLTGFELRTGSDVDAIRVICVAAHGPADIGPLLPGGTSFGGNGPGLGTVQLLCPRDTPIVTGMAIVASGVATIVVKSIHLYCGWAATTQTPSGLPSAIFDGPADTRNATGNPVRITHDVQRCPAGLVAVGAHGKSGIWLDAVGLICGTPKLTRSLKQELSALAAAEKSGPVKALGRAKVEPPPKHLGRAIDLDALAAKGEAIANADPLAAELRNREPEGPSRRGFDIGMAAMEGLTSIMASLYPPQWLPRLLEIWNSLSPAEQGGFNVAISFSQERNRNADLAARGAAIAAADPSVAAARTVVDDISYWLGFDIATGIFGDPALGARGNTATGPGSLNIRDSLSPAGQKGFNASVTFHLSRHYKP